MRLPANAMQHGQRVGRAKRRPARRHEVQRRAESRPVLESLLLARAEARLPRDLESLDSDIVEEEIIAEEAPNLSVSISYEVLPQIREYERTSERFAHGIRSTPTMIVNNRMVIGTLPYEQLHAIFQALIDEHDSDDSRFIENWVE